MPLPQDLLNTLQTAKGFQEPSFKAVHESGEQVTAIRLHPVKGTNIQKSVSNNNVPWCLPGYYLDERPSFTLDPSFHAGAYYVQDASSMFLWQMISQLVPDPASKKVLDLCAAPGGKSTLLASYFTEGFLITNEVIKSRAAILVENMTKWGNSNIVVTNNDPNHFQQLGAYFDVVVVDAPCSGSGLFRKDPNAIAEWSLDHVQLCSQRQQRILADILPALKQDGILLYATCSYSPEENEMIGDWLIDELQMEPLAVTIDADWGIVETVTEKNKVTGYRFYPDRVKGEGFFIAAFKKTNATDIHKLKKNSGIQQPSKNEIVRVKDFIPLSDDYQIFKQGEQFRTIDRIWYHDLQQLAGNLYIRKAGVGIGEIKGKDMVPAHELAMSLLPKDHFNTIVVHKEEALQYLRRQDLSLEALKGWNLVLYEQLPLGWIKALPNRINNYYPQEWRILKQ